MVVHFHLVVKDNQNEFLNCLSLSLVVIEKHSVENLDINHNSHLDVHHLWVFIKDTFCNWKWSVLWKCVTVDVYWNKVEHSYWCRWFLYEILNWHLFSEPSLNSCTYYLENLYNNIENHFFDYQRDLFWWSTNVNVDFSTVKKQIVFCNFWISCLNVFTSNQCWIYCLDIVNDWNFRFHDNVTKNSYVILVCTMFENFYVVVNKCHLESDCNEYLHWVRIDDLNVNVVH